MLVKVNEKLIVNTDAIISAHRVQGDDGSRGWYCLLRGNEAVALEEDEMEKVIAVCAEQLAACSAQISMAALAGEKPAPRIGAQVLP